MPAVRGRVVRVAVVVAVAGRRGRGRLRRGGRDGGRRRRHGRRRRDGRGDRRDRSDVRVRRRAAALIVLARGGQLRRGRAGRRLRGAGRSGRRLVLLRVVVAVALALPVAGRGRRGLVVLRRLARVVGGAARGRRRLRGLRLRRGRRGR